MKEPELMDDGVQYTQVREPSEQIAGRLLGLLVFLAGIALLAFTFVMAYEAFRNTDLIIPVSALERRPPPTPLAVYLPAVIKLILLFAMGYLSSLIAARGAQFFFSARREAQRALPGD